MEFEGRSSLKSRLDMAPLIDVVFLLLIFFMLTSSYMVQEAMNLKLPESDQGSAAEDTAVIITADENSLYTVNGKKCSTYEELKAEIQTAIGGNPSAPVTLKMHQSLTVQEALRIMDMVKESGGSSVNLVTRPAK